MISASLLEFARTGALAGIEIGHSRTHVEEILGRPDTWGMAPAPFETADIWKYGDIEFYFSDHELWMIFTDTFDVPTGGASMNLDPWIIRYGLTRPDFETALHQTDISFTSVANRHNDDEVDVATNAKACFTFREKANAYGPAGLCAMQTRHTKNE